MDLESESEIASSRQRIRPSRTLCDSAFTGGLSIVMTETTPFRSIVTGLDLDMELEYVSQLAGVPETAKYDIRCYRKLYQVQTDGLRRGLPC
jgi:hypothetical protein